MEYGSVIKLNELLNMEQHGQILKALYWKRQVIYKRINTMWFNLDESLKQAKCMYSDRKQISSFLHHDWGCIDNKKEQVKFWKLWKYDVSWLAWWLHWSIYLSKLIESYALNWCFSLLLNYISLMLIFKLTRKKQGVGLSKKKKKVYSQFCCC